MAAGRQGNAGVLVRFHGFYCRETEGRTTIATSPIADFGFTPALEL